MKGRINGTSLSRLRMIKGSRDKPRPAGRGANWSWHNPAGQWEDMVGGRVVFVVLNEA